MRTVAGSYYVSFGKGDSSDAIDRDIELTDEEARIYDAAVADEKDPNEIPELQAALERAYTEIAEEEIDNALEMDDEYVAECQGENEMDASELNSLVADRDPHALAFFGLENASEEELAQWDAYDLAELPMVKDFDEDFEPISPYDDGWSLYVSFCDPNG